MSGLAERIERRMGELGTNQHRVAALAGLRQDAVRDVLRGKVRRPGAENLAKIARALETTSDWLLFGTEPAASSADDSPSRPTGPAEGANHIRQRREALGWSQAELAERAGTTQQTVDRIERGQTEFSRHTPAILAALDGADPTVKGSETVQVANGRVTLNLNATVSVGTAAKILALIEEDKA